MKINNDLVEKWNPKIQKLSSNTFVIGMDREDIAQELRIVLLKAAEKFDETRGVSFHTYLHTAMVNTLRTLISHAQRHPIVSSLDETVKDSDMLPTEVVKALSVNPDFDEHLSLENLMDRLSEMEKEFLILRLEGLTMGEITEDLGESSYKIRQSLRDKIRGNQHEFAIKVTNRI